jgi:hypothetical protein
MLNFSIEREEAILGYDSELDENITTEIFYVIVSNQAGKKWRHCENFSNLFEMVNEVGAVVYRENKEAKNSAMQLMKILQNKRLVSIENQPDFSEI